MRFLAKLGMASLKDFEIDFERFLAKGDKKYEKHIIGNNYRDFDDFVQQ